MNCCEFHRWLQRPGIMSGVKKGLATIRWRVNHGSSFVEQLTFGVAR